MNYTAICPTKGRKFVTERALKCFLEQDYEGFATLLIYNNSHIPLELGNLNLPHNRNVILINNHLDLSTNQPYTNLGSIYQDILSFIPEDTEVISHFECDDIFLQGYIKQGVEGLQRNDCEAWKPKKSFYRTGENTLHLVENIMEPSMFFRYYKVKDVGYEPITGAQFHKLIKSVDNFVVEDVPIPQFMYVWDGEYQVFKTSGALDNPENFQNYEKHSQDFGNGILEPWSSVQKYEDEASHFLNK